MEIQHQLSAVVELGDRPLLAGGADLVDLPLHFLHLIQPDQFQLQLALLLHRIALIPGRLILNWLEDQLKIAQRDDKDHQKQQHGRFPLCQLPIHFSTALSGPR